MVKPGGRGCVSECWRTWGMGMSMGMGEGSDGGENIDDDVWRRDR